MADGNYPTYVTESTTITWPGPQGTIRPAGSFINFVGTSSTSGSGFLGVTNQDIPANATNIPIGVDVEGIVQVISGGPIAAGSALTCAVTTGEFVVAAATNDVHGRALTAATAAGQRILMKITREGKA